jgi:predicted phosphodiesterase
MIIVGDVHGKFKRFSNIIKEANGTPIIQVGDMGVGFNASKDWTNDYKMNQYYSDNNVRFIRGNHDNPGVCKELSTWIPDGFIEKDVMYIGGAHSIDREYRTENLDWWSDEECSTNQFDEMCKTYTFNKPRVMITHDCPSSVAPTLFSDVISWQFLYNRTAEFFDQLFKIHQPELWVFGHWHYSRNCIIEGTRFNCLAELEAKDFSYYF